MLNVELLLKTMSEILSDKHGLDIKVKAEPIETAQEKQGDAA